MTNPRGILKGIMLRAPGGRYEATCLNKPLSAVEESQTLLSGDELSFASSNRVCRLPSIGYSLLKAISSAETSGQILSNQSSFDTDMPYGHNDPRRGALEALSSLRIDLSCDCYLRSHLDRTFFSRGSPTVLRGSSSQVNLEEKKHLFDESFCDSSLLVPSIYGSAGSGLTSREKCLSRDKANVQKTFSLPSFDAFASSVSPMKRATCNPTALGLPPLAEVLNTEFSNEKSTYPNYISLKLPAFLHDYATEPRLMLQRSPLPPRSPGAHCFISEGVKMNHLNGFKLYSRANDLLFSVSSKGSLDLGVYGSSLTSQFSRYPLKQSSAKSLRVLNSSADSEKSVQGSVISSTKFSNAPICEVLGIETKDPLVPRCFRGYARVDKLPSIKLEHYPVLKSTKLEKSSFSPTSKTPKASTPHGERAPTHLQPKISKLNGKAVKKRLKTVQARKPDYFKSKGSCIVKFYFTRPETRQLLQYVELTVGPPKPPTVGSLKKRSNAIEVGSFQATAEELANANTKLDKKGPRQKWQDTPGCWTCRVRRKLCPQDAEFCRACYRLKLSCDRSATKPFYMKQKDALMKARRAIREITDVGRREALKSFNMSKAKKAANSVSGKSKPESSR